jgi:hypothetical protein
MKYSKSQGLSSFCKRLKENGKSIYCETLQLETNFLRVYKSCQTYEIKDPLSAIVINAWFREGLGIEATQCELPLQIEPCYYSPFAKFKACTGHPQIVVRLATWLGLISVILGLLGLVVSLKGVI